MKLLAVKLIIDYLVGSCLGAPVWLSFSDLAVDESIAPTNILGDATVVRCIEYAKKLGQTAVFDATTSDCKAYVIPKSDFHKAFRSQPESYLWWKEEQGFDCQKPDLVQMPLLGDVWASQQNSSKDCQSECLEKYTNILAAVFHIKQEICYCHVGRAYFMNFTKAFVKPSVLSLFCVLGCLTRESNKGPIEATQRGCRSRY